MIKYLKFLLVFACLPSVKIHAVENKVLITALSEEKAKRINDLYFSMKSLVSRLNPNWIPTDNEEKLPAYTIKVSSNSGQSVVTLVGSIYLELDAENLNLGILALNNDNFFLRKPVGKNKLPTTYTLPQALKRAHEYLDALKIQVPADAFLTECTYRKSIYNEWIVKWNRTFRGYHEHSFLDADYSDGIAVKLGQNGEFLGMSRRWREIQVQNFEIKIEQFKAVELAISAVPALQETEIYKTYRGRGFPIIGLISSKLEVCFPNWWLDPKRAITLIKEPHKERRLCWVVELATSDQGVNSDGTPTKATTNVKLTLHIDASTGEIIGADIL